MCYNQMTRIKGLLERQYQLAAQKRHEEQLKFNYYTQIAGYFERECAITKQYNSWVTKENQINANYIQKKVKDEKLQLRREKLKKLLEEEERQYKQECEKLEKRKKRQEIGDSQSLEALRQRLLKKKAEHRLYVPNLRRRHQSYFYNSDGLLENSQKTSATLSNSSSRHSQEYATQINSEGSFFTSNSKNSSRSPSSVQQDRLSKSTSNLSQKTTVPNQAINNCCKIMEKNNFKYAPTMDHLSDHFTYSRSPTMKDRVVTINNNSVNSHTRSMQNTNLRYESSKIVEDHNSSTSHQESHATIPEEPSEIQELEAIPIRESYSFNGDQVDHAENNYEQNAEIKYITEDNNESNELNYGADEDGAKDQENSKSHANFSKVNYKDTTIAVKNRLRTGEERESKFSIPMFLSLQYKNMKSQIQDLERREILACRARRWEEALRLRDMCNRLSITQERELINVLDSTLDEESRNAALRSIQERERLLNEREHICSDSYSLYSEDAKVLWQKWMEEDIQLKKEVNYTEKELLMKNLEEDWKNLTLEDKKRIEQQQEKVLNKSSLQDELNRMKYITSNR